MHDFVYAVGWLLGDTLSFAEYVIPFDISNCGNIDSDLCFVETLISAPWP